MKKSVVDPSEFNRKKFTNYRNLYNKVLREAKKQYFENGFRKYKPNPKKIWEPLNEITSRNRNRETISEIKIGQNQSTNSTNIANHFNGFF